MVFIVGAPRSGTTWLQLLLAQHPRVATSQETHLFERYLSHLDEMWRWEASFEAERKIGLRPLLEDEAFYALCREFARGVLDRIGADAPDATVVIEKTPGHVLTVPFIHTLFPDAFFLHVVRDPRAVVSSLLRAGKGWGARWAPRGATTAADVWSRHVEAGLAIPSHTDRVQEIRYESLHDTGVEVLEEVLDALGLAVEDGWAASAFEACALDRLRKGGADTRLPWAEAEPDGFFGRGERDGWREELTRGQLRAVEYVAAPWMGRLGYERLTRGSRAPLSSRGSRALERIRSGLDWRLRRVAAGL